MEDRPTAESNPPCSIFRLRRPPFFVRARLQSSRSNGCWAAPSKSTEHPPNLPDRGENITHPTPNLHLSLRPKNRQVRLERCFFAPRREANGIFPCPPIPQNMPNSCTQRCTHWIEQESNRSS